jgi:hypothetical protein
MENTRRRYGLSETSVLLTVPRLRIRCQRSDCQGSECVNWRFCGPASPFGSYLDHLPHAFVCASGAIAAAPSIPA